MNQLVDVLPAKYRRYAYLLVTVLLIVGAAYETHNHDWKATVAALFTAFWTAVAHANTSATPPSAPEASPPTQ